MNNTNFWSKNQQITPQLRIGSNHKVYLIVKMKNRTIPINKMLLFNCEVTTGVAVFTTFQLKE